LKTIRDQHPGEAIGRVFNVAKRYSNTHIYEGDIVFESCGGFFEKRNGICFEKRRVQIRKISPIRFRPYLSIDHRSLQSFVRRVSEHAIPRGLKDRSNPPQHHIKAPPSSARYMKYARLHCLRAILSSRSCSSQASLMMSFTTSATGLISWIKPATCPQAIGAISGSPDS